MNARDHDSVFRGSVPALYQRYLVPLIFEPYAKHVAERLRAEEPRRVLETAAGTGVVTRALALALPHVATIVATDLNGPMLEEAAGVGTARPVEWREADATELPFDSESFDAVVCQFGVMFFPDRPRAYAEARRVLRPGGVFVFSVWDRLEENEFAECVSAALAARFPDDPPRFIARTPYGYHRRADIERELSSAGWSTAPKFETVAERSRADSFEIPAIAYCQGTPLRNEIEARDPDGLAGATECAAEAIAGRFGRGAVEGRIQAHIVTVRREA